MADQHDAGAQAGQLLFQPFDAGKIEMVGRLVQQQDVGFRRQHAGQSGAPRLAAGQVARVLGAGQPELFQQVACAVLVGAAASGQAGFDILQRGREAGKIGLLWQIADGGAGLGEAPAGIRLHQARGDPQQGRFAGAVAADQADPVAGGNRQTGTGQQRRGAEGEGDVLQREKRRGHGGAL